MGSNDHPGGLLRRPSALRRVVCIAAAVLPLGPKRFLYRRLLGWEIDRSAVIGRSFIEVGHLVMGPGAEIGSLNVIKGCDRVEVGRESAIGSMNWISGLPRSSGAFPATPDRRPELIMGEKASLVTRHLIDCSDRVHLHDRSLLGGARIQVLTHEVDRAAGIQQTRPVVLRPGAYVLNGVTLLAGTVIPENSVVAAGAVVAKPFQDQGWLYGGVPAKPIKPLPPGEAFFARPERKIS